MKDIASCKKNSSFLDPLIAYMLSLLYGSEKECCNVHNRILRDCQWSLWYPRFSWSELRRKSSTSKNALIQYQQLARYIWLLQENGTRLPQEITKFLKDDIWELRPGNNRVFYFFFKDDTFVLLHHFRKKSQKTPQKEINRAISEMHDYLSRKV